MVLLHKTDTAPSMKHIVKEVEPTSNKPKFYYILDSSIINIQAMESINLLIPIQL